MPRPAEMPALRGLPNPNTTPLPNCIVDDYLPYFTGAELKVILYLVRRTLGFHKTRDVISLSQICNGIVRKDGRRLDHGTGLHKSTACDALNSLINWGMIKRVTRRDPVRGDLPTEYILWIDGESDTDPEEAAGEEQPRRLAMPSNATIATKPFPEHPRRRAVGTDPVSGQADPPVSDSPDTPLSDLPDRQDAIVQTKRRNDLSNTRRASLSQNSNRQRRETQRDDVELAAKTIEGGPEPARVGGPSKATDDQQAAEPIINPMREELHQFAEVVAREFNDAAPFRATLSRLVNLYHRSGLSTKEFAERVDAARQQTKERTVAIRLPANGPTGGMRSGKNKMPYFFALLEDHLGLREGGLRHDDESKDVSRQADDSPFDDPVREPNRASATGDKPVLDQSLTETEHRTAPSTPVTPVRTARGDADARLIVEVIREFSLQFSDAAAAAALADWAVALWRGSDVSPRRFLEIAQVASEGMMRDPAQAASATHFRSRVEATLLASVGTGRAITSPEKGIYLASGEGANVITNPRMRTASTG